MGLRMSSSAKVPMQYIFNRMFDWGSGSYIVQGVDGAEEQVWGYYISRNEDLFNVERVLKEFDVRWRRLKIVDPRDPAFVISPPDEDIARVKTERDYMSELIRKHRDLTLDVEFNHGRYYLVGNWIYPTRAKVMYEKLAPLAASLSEVMGEKYVTLAYEGDRGLLTLASTQRPSIRGIKYYKVTRR